MSLVQRKLVKQFNQTRGIKALFSNCDGISNSSEISQYYMNNNATATVIAATGTPVKIAGTTTSATITSKFTNTDNRATYMGSQTKIFKITATDLNVTVR